MADNVPFRLTGEVHGRVTYNGEPVPYIQVRLSPLPSDLSFIDADYNKTLYQQPDAVIVYTDADGKWSTRVLAPGDGVSPSEAKWSAYAVAIGVDSAIITKAANRETPTDFGDIVVSDRATPGGGTVDLGPLTRRVQALENKPAGEALTPQQKADLASIFTLTNRVHALETTPKVDLGPLTQRVEKLEANKPIGTLVLKSGDPVPAGTPAGTIIVRI